MQLVRRHLWLMLIAAHCAGLALITSSALRDAGDGPQQLAGPGASDAFLLADASHRLPSPHVTHVTFHLELVPHPGQHVIIVMTWPHRRAPTRGPI
jgi:hypothetical protein